MDLATRPQREAELAAALLLLRLASGVLLLKLVEIRTQNQCNLKEIYDFDGLTRK